MKNLRLIPVFLQQEAVVKVVFTYDNELISLVKAQKGVRGNTTLRSWYFPKKHFRLPAFYQDLKGKFFINYPQLNQGLLGFNNSNTQKRHTQVSTQEIGNIVNPPDNYYRKESGSIYTKNGSIAPLNQRDNKNKHHKGEYIQ